MKRPNMALKDLWSKTVLLFKNLLPKPKPGVYKIASCVHCGRPFKQTSVDGGEPVIECKHEGKTTEYVFSYPNTRRVKIVRQNKSKWPPSHFILQFCEFCFLMKPEFVGLRIKSPCTIYYIWKNQKGEHYEHYEYGNEHPKN